MADFVSSNYEWFIAFHIIAVIAWMAGMLYLPRLYVYHTKFKEKSEAYETFKVMELKLLRLIINPAMITSWAIGGLMLYANPHLMSNGWFHVKLTALVLMQIFHAFLSIWRKGFFKNKNEKTETFYRVVNEIPTILMIIIVIMVIVKPF